MRSPSTLPSFGLELLDFRKLALRHFLDEVEHCFLLHFANLNELHAGQISELPTARHPLAVAAALQPMR